MSNTIAIKDVLDFTVEAYSSTTTRGTILFRVPYSTETTISAKGTRLTIRGGQGNYKIIDLDHSKDFTLKATLPLVDMIAFAVKNGRSMVTGAATAPCTEILTASASNTITLTNAPLANTLKVYLVSGTRDIGVEQTVGTPATIPNTYSIASSVVTLNATTVPAGTKVYVFYSYTSGVNATDLKLTASDFPTFIRITGRGFGTDDVTGQRIPMSFDVKKAKVQINWDLTMTEEKATELDFTCDCYPILDPADNKTQLVVDMVRLVDEAY